jgi:hypothetical protein
MCCSLQNYYYFLSLSLNDGGLVQLLNWFEPPLRQLWALMLGQTKHFLGLSCMYVPCLGFWVWIFLNWNAGEPSQFKREQNTLEREETNSTLIVNMKKSHEREIAPHFLIIISCCINSQMSCGVSYIFVWLFKFRSQIYWRKITKPYYRMDSNIFDRTIHGPKAESSTGQFRRHFFATLQGCLVQEEHELKELNLFCFCDLFWIYYLRQNKEDNQFFTPALSSAPPQHLNLDRPWALSCRERLDIFTPMHFTRLCSFIFLIHLLFSNRSAWASFTKKQQKQNLPNYFSNSEC